MLAVCPSWDLPSPAACCSMTSEASWDPRTSRSDFSALSPFHLSLALKLAGPCHARPHLPPGSKCFLQRLGHSYNQTQGMASSGCAADPGGSCRAALPLLLLTSQRRLEQPHPAVQLPDYKLLPSLGVISTLHPLEGSIPFARQPLPPTP